MYGDLESTLSIGSADLDLVAGTQLREVALRGLHQAGLLTAWEAQSQLATVVLISLVAFAPLAVTVVVMLSWSLTATFVYYHARLRGLPDVFETRWSLPTRRSHGWLPWVAATAVSLVKAWSAGFQPYLYSRAVSSFLGKPARRGLARLCRWFVLSAALVLFGVTADHYLLRRAGLPNRTVLRLCFLGSFLNVSYRVALSGFLVALCGHLARSIA